MTPSSRAAWLAASPEKNCSRSNTSVPFVASTDLMIPKLLPAARIGDAEGDGDGGGAEVAAGDGDELTGGELCSATSGLPLAHAAPRNNRPNVATRRRR